MAVSKTFFSPLAAATENFQNWSLLYCTSIRLDDMGIALETQFLFQEVQISCCLTV